jgi:hypothetical protein
LAKASAPRARRAGMGTTMALVVYFLPIALQSGQGGHAPRRLGAPFGKSLRRAMYLITLIELKW